MTIQQIITEVTSIISAIAALVVSIRTKGVVTVQQKAIAAHADKLAKLEEKTP